MLELGDELQYYATEVGDWNPLSSTAAGDELGVGASENPDARPSELVDPSR